MRWCCEHPAADPKSEPQSRHLILPDGSVDVISAGGPTVVDEEVVVETVEVDEVAAMPAVVGGWAAAEEGSAGSIEGARAPVSGGGHARWCEARPALDLQGFPQWQTREVCPAVVPASARRW